MRAPLSGIRVVELSTYVAAPAAGALLADLGADVVKVEVPDGEVIRHSRPRINGFESRFPGSPQFEMDNRGKRSLTLDLGVDAHREALLRVLDQADVFVTNMLPGRRAKFGIDAASVRARNPRLVYATLSGYGGGGDEADKPAFDYAALWARTGMMDITRDPSAPPAFQRPGVGDHAAALSLVCGVLAALRMRDRDDPGGDEGQGQEVDVSLLQTGLYMLGNDLSQVLATGENAPMHDRAKPRNPLWNHYRTQDGRWLMLVMIESHNYWTPFLEAIGRPELEHDPRFSGPRERYRNSAELVELLDDVFASRPLAEWTEVLSGHRVIWAPVQRMLETLADPQIESMGYFREIDHPEHGQLKTMGPPLLMSAHDIPASSPAPELGAHSAEVLRAAGLREAEIAEILGDAPSRLGRSSAR